MFHPFLVYECKFSSFVSFANVAFKVEGYLALGELVESGQEKGLISNMGKQKTSPYHTQVKVIVPQTRKGES